MKIWVGYNYGQGSTNYWLLKIIIYELSKDEQRFNNYLVFIKGINYFIFYPIEYI
jgi:hypothetical protein